MKLYFSPMAGSLAVRIALYEAGLEATFHEVARKTKALEDGRDYREIHPLGLVPLLELDDGQRLTELTAILGHLAALRPTTARSGNGDWERVRLTEALAFVATELHKGTFFPLFDRNASAAVREYAATHGEARLTRLQAQLEGRTWMLDDFGVADAYLLTVLSWCVATPIPLERWPTLLAYLKRGLKRPAVARAISEEKALFVDALARGGEALPAAV